MKFRWRNRCFRSETSISSGNNMELMWRNIDFFRKNMKFGWRKIDFFREKHEVQVAKSMFQIGNIDFFRKQHGANVEKHRFLQEKHEVRVEKDRFLQEET